MTTLLELEQESVQLSIKIRTHLMKVPFPDKNRHAEKLCNECRPWFLRKSALIKEIYAARNAPKSIETLVPNETSIKENNE